MNTISNPTPEEKTIDEEIDANHSSASQVVSVFINNDEYNFESDPEEEGVTIFINSDQYQLEGDHGEEYAGEGTNEGPQVDG